MEVEKSLFYSKMVSDHPKAEEIFTLLKGFSGHVSLQSNLLSIKNLSLEDYSDLLKRTYSSKFSVRAAGFNTTDKYFVLLKLPRN